MIHFGILLILGGTAWLAVDHIKGGKDENTLENGGSGDGGGPDREPGSDDFPIHGAGLNVGLVPENMGDGGSRIAGNDSGSEQLAAERNRPPVRVVTDKADKPKGKSKNVDKNTGADDGCDDGDDVRREPTGSPEHSGAADH